MKMMGKGKTGDKRNLRVLKGVILQEKGNK